MAECRAASQGSLSWVTQVGMLCTTTAVIPLEEHALDSSDTCTLERVWKTRLFV